MTPVLGHGISHGTGGFPFTQVLPDPTAQAHSILCAKLRRDLNVMRERSLIFFFLMPNPCYSLSWLLKTWLLKIFFL